MSGRTLRRMLRTSGLLCEGATGIGGIQGSQRRYRGAVEPCARAEIATLI